MAELNDWDIAAANNNDAPPDGWPENTMNYSEVNDTAREGMAVVARYFKDINGSLVTAGAADAYTVTLNASYAAYFTGMYVVAEFHALNTGASTINVNGIGIQSIVDRDGSALDAGVIQAGGIYELRYDGTDFQLMGTIAGAAVSVSSLDISSTTPQLAIIDTDAPADEKRWVLNNTGGTLNVSTQTDAEGAGIDMIAAVRTGTGVDTVTLNVAAGEAALVATANGAVDLYHNNIKRASAEAGGAWVIRSDGNTDAETRAVALTHQDDTTRGMFGHAGSDAFLLANQIHGGNIEFSAESAVGIPVVVLVGDPDALTTLQAATDLHLEVAGGVSAETALVATANGSVELYYDNTARLSTEIGRVDVKSDGNTDTEIRILGLTHQDGTLRGFFGYASNDVLGISNEIHGGSIGISAEDSGGTPRIVLLADPDALTTLIADTNLHLQVAAGESALVATANGAVSLYYDNGLRFATGASGAANLNSDGNTDTEDRLLNFAHLDGTLRGLVGHNSGANLDLDNRINSGHVQLLGRDAASAARTFLIGDPDARTTLRGDTDVRLEVGSSGETALIANLDTYVSLFYNNVEKFRSADETAADQITGAEVVNGSGTMKPVGLGVVENDATTFDTVATHTPFQQINAGETIYFVGAGAGTANWDTYTNVESGQTNIPNGTMWFVQQNAATTLLDIRGGTGVTIRFWIGDGAAPADVDVSVARSGVVTVRKVSDSVYDVWGIGAS